MTNNGLKGGGYRDRAFLFSEGHSMKKPAPRRDKYFLRDLHQRIDLYDRKLAYLDKYVDFASPEDREEAKQTLRAKRAPLEKTALELAASGVEFEEKDLSRSFSAMNLVYDGARKNLSLVKRS
jgi:hypothetical protein